MSLDQLPDPQVLMFVAGGFGLLTLLLFVLLLVTRARLTRAQSETLRAESAAAEAAKAAEARDATQAAEFAAFRKKYSAITDQETEVARLAGIASQETITIEMLRTSYATKKQTFDELLRQVAIYDERLAFAELGIYEPHFDFTDSDEFKVAIAEVRDRQKGMVKAKDATWCPTEWTVEGSKAKGQTMINRQTRLTMRAFNNEAEAAIANTRWNNAAAMEKRIRAAATAIEKENTSLNLTINPAYVELKIEELRLTHEYRERLKREKEERAEMARAEREEKKLLAEAEAAEREEAKYQALLERARKEAEANGGTAELTGRVAELEAALAEAHAASERARAMAEMTKSGYVYIISNIGSFGEDVVKISLTRRLEPDDRVRELGDASVPFGFDTHAMIYSEEAPALEHALHVEFADRRINTSNFRKEFFRVRLEEVEEAVARLAPDASFFKDREAQEWHETLARRSAALIALQEEARVTGLPAEI